MKIIIDKKEIELSPNEVYAAKRMVQNFVKTIRDKCSEMDRPSVYLTTLIMMHIMSGDLIESMTPETLAKILNAFNKQQ